MANDAGGGGLLLGFGTVVDVKMLMVPSAYGNLRHGGSDKDVVSSSPIAGR